MTVQESNEDVFRESPASAKPGHTAGHVAGQLKNGAKTNVTIHVSLRPSG